MILRHSLVLVLFFLFIVEGSIYQVFAPDFHGYEYLFIPRIVFMIIIFAGIFRGRAYGTLHAVVFGVLYDVIFSSVLGVYTFAMGLIAYLLSVPHRFFQRNLVVTIVTTMLGVGILEYFVYGMMTLLGFTTVIHDEFLYLRFIPTMIMNFIVIAILAYPLRKYFYFVKQREEDQVKFNS